MKYNFSNILSYIKKRPDLFFFSLFLLTSMLSVRKVLFFYPINGSFNEYTGVYVYLSDIFLFLTLVSYFILCNNNIKLSTINYIKIFSDFSSKKALLVSRGTLQKSYSQIINSYTLFFPLFAVFFSFLSILWATNKSIAFFTSIKLTEFVLLFYYIINLVPRETNPKNIVNIQTKRVLFHVKQNEITTQFSLKFAIILFTFIGFFQSIIGIMQFITQRSVGFFWLKESIISPTIPGVAKVVFHGKTFIRAYGLFPHPNIFGGYLVFSILITLLYINLTSKKNNFKVVSRGTILKLALAIQAFALVLTFSKSAILGLIIALFFIFHTKKQNNLNSKNKYFLLFHVEQKKIFSLIFLSLFMVFLFIAFTKPDLNVLFLKSLKERVLFLNVSQFDFLKAPFLGLGSGQFIPYMANSFTLETWQYQPVHNVFLLILNNYGFFFAIGFIFFIYKLFSTRQNFTFINVYLKGVLLAFIFIMLFDHYLWDIQQGEIFFWLTCAIIVSCS